MSRRVFDENKESGDVHGGYAFALTQLGKLKEARELAFKGYEIKPTHTWTHHAIAHRMFNPTIVHRIGIKTIFSFSV